MIVCRLEPPRWDAQAPGDVVEADLGPLHPLAGDVLAARRGAHALGERADHPPAGALGRLDLGEMAGAPSLR